MRFMHTHVPTFLWPDIRHLSRCPILVGFAINFPLITTIGQLGPVLLDETALRRCLYRSWIHSPALTAPRK